MNERRKEGKEIEKIADGKGKGDDSVE